MKLSVLLQTSALSATSLAQTSKYCPSGSGEICYSLNVPDQTASSGNGDIFFQIKGPSTKQWIAVGQGEQMAGANIFVIYADAGSTNVTLSPRLGKGHVEPLFNQDAEVFLLEGSGIKNGQITANVRCSNCRSWSGGSMDFTSSKASWMWAVNSGSPLRDNSRSTGLDQHSAKGTFTFDLTKARGGSSLNPFIEAAASASPKTSASSSVADATTTAGAVTSSGESDGDNSDGNEDTAQRATTAHGAIMGLTFVIVFPLGAVIIRLCSIKALVWVHAMVQIFGYILALAGLGLGIFIAIVPSFQLHSYHPIIGIIVIALLVFQPILGLLHHRLYQNTLKSSLWCVVHVWLGRVAITLGIINGGLGLRLADNTMNGEIVYGAIAGLVWLSWVGVMMWSYSRSKASST